jgi:DNA-3-methyladenine glycosylase
VGAIAALPPAFYDRPVLQVARDLLGCTFVFQGVGGRIVETEAYAPGDHASHSFNGRTDRNAVMFGPPGHLYVYFTYGMHFCANLVCEAEGVGAAVLVRALEPLQGIERMIERRGPVVRRADGSVDARLLCGGPARLAQALALGRAQNGLPAWRDPLVVLPRPGTSAVDPATWSSAAPEIAVTPRIGVGGDASPWRFVEARSAFLSRPLPRNGGSREAARDPGPPSG